MMRIPTRVIPDKVARNLWKRVLAVEVTRNPSKGVIPVGVVGVSLQSAEIILIEVSWFFLYLVLFFTLVLLLHLVLSPSGRRN